MATTQGNKEQKKAFSKRFLEARIASGLSQIKLAKLTGISNSTISNYEVGKTMPDDKNLRKLAKHLPLLNEQSAAPKKASIIQTAKVSIEDAQTAYMRSLVTASQGVKDLLSKAQQAGVSEQAAVSMLKELGVNVS
jgi:transcriptional regulator with XRE-family HTH domain